MKKYVIALLLTQSTLDLRIAVENYAQCLRYVAEGTERVEYCVSDFQHDKGEILLEELDLTESFEDVLHREQDRLRSLPREWRGTKSDYYRRLSDLYFDWSLDEL